MERPGNSFRFWQRWLQCVSAAAALFGLVFVLAPGSIILTGYHQQVVAAFHGDGAAAGALAQQRWAISVIGSSMLGWGILLTWVATVPFARREAWAWQATALSVLAWIVGDSVVSLRAGVLLEVLFNAVVAVLIGLPLAMTRKSMVRVPTPEGAASAAQGRVAPKPR